MKADAAGVALAENSVAYDYAAATLLGDVASLGQYATQFGVDRAALSPLLHDASRQRDLAQGDAAFKAYMAQSDGINRDLKTATPASVARAGVAVAALAYGTIARPLDALALSAAGAATKANTAAKRSSDTTTVVVWIAAILALLVAATLSTAITRSITHPAVCIRGSAAAGRRR